MEPALTPLNGGWSGETFLAESGAERTVVRIYAGRSAARGPDAPEVDAAVLRLVRGLVPVPEVLEVRRADPDRDAPGLLVTSWVAGRRGDDVLPGLDPDGLRLLGAQVGRVAATLAGMPTLTGGLFRGADLAVVPWAPVADGLPGWVEQHEPRLGGWSPPELAGLRAVAERAQRLLDTTGRTCLVHSDLNPKNWLVAPGALEIVAVLDWEFAHAGHPFSDLGNAVRLERDPAWVDAVVGAYVDLRGGSASDALDLARSADLWALVDLAARAGENPVADTADRLLRAIARARDVHAWHVDDASG